MYSPTSYVDGPLTLGATLWKTGARFRVWAPFASSVELQLISASTNAASPFPLTLENPSNNYWIADIDGVIDGDLYQYVITNRGGDTYDAGGSSLLRIDPAARQVQTSVATFPGRVVSTVFSFFSSFVTPKFSDFIIYQAHVGSFAGRSDGLPVITDLDGSTAGFSSTQTKIAYIRNLGFNAVLFLPTGEYRGTEGEAYNPSNYFAPEQLYGTPESLRILIDACHSAGLAVFFDVVYNHMDPTDNLWQFDGNSDHRTIENDPNTGGGIYFSAIETGFGRRPDHDNPEVQRFFIENARMWFDEYHIDGMRFDSASNISNNGLKAIVSNLRGRYPDKFIHAEDNDLDYIFQEIGFSACWDMGSADVFARCIAQSDLGQLQTLVNRFGFPTAYSPIRYLLGSHDQTFNQWQYNSDADAWRWDKPGSQDGLLRENRWFVERIGGAVVGRDNWFARAQARLGWALNVAIPCTPMLFMGNECLQRGYWNPSLDNFGDHRFDWSIAGDAIAMGMRSLVQDANAVRWNHPALRSDLGPLITHVDHTNNVLAFRRWNLEGDVILVVVNLSDNEWADPVYRVASGLPFQIFREVFNSQSPQYGGWNDSGNYLDSLSTGIDGFCSIRLPKWSVLMFSL